MSVFLINISYICINETVEVSQDIGLKNRKATQKSSTLFCCGFLILML